LEVIIIMIYEFTGQYKINKDGTIYLFDKTFNRKFRIEGQDTKVFIDALPYFTGTYSMEEVCSQSNVEEAKLKELIEELKGLNLIKSYDNSRLDLIILIDGHKHSAFLQKIIVDNKKLSGCNIKIGDIDSLKQKEVSKNTSTLILSINTHYNKEFINKIEDMATKYKVNFLNISLFGNKSYIGPLFSFEDGPCSECLNKSNIIKDDDYHETLGHSYNALSEMVINEIIRFIRENTYVNSFNTVIEVDFSNLELKKTNVYKLPNCKKCKYKQELVQ
jgi:hypothetical protein